MKDTRLMRDGDYHMSFAEIAKELGVTRQTVRTIQENALRKIAHKLVWYKGYERDRAIQWFGDDYE